MIGPAVDNRWPLWAILTIIDSSVGGKGALEERLSRGDRCAANSLIQTLFISLLRLRLIERPYL